jgi:uncharacterized protein (TIGR00369 family)
MDSRSPRRLRIGGKLEELLPIELVERGSGRFTIAAQFDETHLNAAGVVHGGFIMSLLDVALAGGAVSAVDGGRGKYGITISMTVNFVRGLGPGPVRCTAEVAGGGERTKFVDARLLRAEGGEGPYATATATIRVVDLPEE